MGELFKTAETNPSLVFEWLADLSVAQRSRIAESDFLTEVKRRSCGASARRLQS
jgi:hypothetical protein